jgi:hypothetical protein
MAKRHGVKRFYSARPGRRPRSPAGGANSRVDPVPASRRIALDAIDWSLAIRTINVEHVGRLADAAVLPPILVWEFETGRYRGIDGYHRWRLAKSRGETTVVAAVHRFPAGAAGEKAFDLECVRANLRHGLPLTRDERDRAIVRIWRRWGQREGGEGETLEDLGRLFNLTKQRIHQIVAAAQRSDVPGARSDRIVNLMQRRNPGERRPNPGGSPQPAGCRACSRIQNSSASCFARTRTRLATSFVRSAR